MAGPTTTDRTGGDLRGFELRSARARSLGASLSELYPASAGTELKRRNLRLLRACVRAGVPIDHLETRWSDYRGTEVKATAQVRAFAERVEFHAGARDGLLVVGGRGTGKSLLCYLAAKEALRRDLPVLCLSLREWVEKKLYQRHNPALFEEMLRMLDEARLVVLDDVWREAGEREARATTWSADDAYEFVERATGGRRARALIVNTCMARKEFEAAVGHGFSSRVAAYERATLKAANFRARPVDLEELMRLRAGPGEARCWRPLSFVDVADERGSSLPDACSTCAYSNRAALCRERLVDGWRE